MVKNEQDVIERMIRHTARLVDTMVVLDNASVDATRDITVECARELGNVVVCDTGEFAYAQSARMTAMFHHIQAAFFADFVLLLDADEFLSVPDRESLERLLIHIPPNGIGYVPWQTLVIPPGQTASCAADVPSSFSFRRAAEEPSHAKVILRPGRALQPDWSITQGNHDVHTGSGLPPASIKVDGLTLFHVPVRSRAQVVSKAVVGWMAYLALDPRAALEGRNGFQWRQTFDEVLFEPTGLSDEALPELSMRYAQDRGIIDWSRDVAPVKLPDLPARRHSDGIYADPMAVIIRSWERSLSGAGELLSLRKPVAVAALASVAETSFDADWHWDNLFVDIAPFRFLAERDRPVSVLDIGCGIGAYLRLFERFGASTIFGIDGIPVEATAVLPGQYTSRDLAEPIMLDRHFDLVVCLEVVEHMLASHENILLDTISNHAGTTILFSAASPGQPGHGHINCRPIEYWLNAWTSRGWVPQLPETLGMRGVATLSWFRRNIVVLRRGSPASGAAAIAALTEIGRKPFAWYSQPPGIRHTAFREPTPEPKAGYVEGHLPVQR